MPWEATARNDVSVIVNPKESGSQGIRVTLWFCTANSDLLMGYQKLKALHYEGLLRKGKIYSNALFHPSKASL